MRKLVIHTDRPDDTVTLYPSGRQNILSILRSGGMLLSAPCGGGGRCGMCAVWLRGEVSGPDSAETELLLKHGRIEQPPGEGFVLRLACRATVLGECELCFTKGSAPYVLTDTTDTVYNPVDSGTKENKQYVPPLPTGHPQTGTVTELNKNGRCADEELRMAFDLGTTTVSYAAVRNNRIVYRRTELNAQRAFGADVISRIAYCNENGTDKPCSAIREQLYSMLRSAVAELGEDAAIPGIIPVAGNTVMLYLLCGMSPEELGLAPYVPSERFGRTERLNGGFTAYLPPCTGGFTGGDLTCCLAAVEAIRNGGRAKLTDEADTPEEASLAGLLRESGRVIVCDFGTNGEIALYSGKAPDSEIYVTSTAAGPALEGGCISCGSGAVAGAISCMYPAGDSRTSGFGYDVIGGGKALSLSGSALLELTALLLDRGVIDQTGRMSAGEYAVCEGVSFTQADVRQIQLAKGAVFAAAARLTELAGTDGKPCVPDAVIITGGLGYRADARTVRRLGLLPIDNVPPDRVYYAPALALEGALLCCGNEGRLLAERTAKRCRCVELSGDGRFEELFIESMEFPER